MAAEYMNFMAQQHEQNEYYRMNLLQCIEQFLRGEQNEKHWSYCDMLFTAFLHGTLYIMYEVEGGHDLYMEPHRA
jgi:hypothetical protein